MATDHALESSDPLRYTKDELLALHMPTNMPDILQATDGVTTMDSLSPALRTALPNKDQLLRASVRGKSSKYSQKIAGSELEVEQEGSWNRWHRSDRSDESGKRRGGRSNHDENILNDETFGDLTADNLDTDDTWALMTEDSSGFEHDRPGGNPEQAELEHSQPLPAKQEENLSTALASMLGGDVTTNIKPSAASSQPDTKLDVGGSEMSGSGMPTTSRLLSAPTGVDGSLRAQSAIVGASASGSRVADEEMAPSADDIRAAKGQLGVGALLWFYKDPQGIVRGPYTHTNMREWLDAKYFDGSLPVRCGRTAPFAPLESLFADMGHAFTRAAFPPQYVARIRDAVQREQQPVPSHAPAPVQPAIHRTGPTAPAAPSSGGLAGLTVDQLRTLIPQLDAWLQEQQGRLAVTRQRLEEGERMMQTAVAQGRMEEATQIRGELHRMGTAYHQATAAVQQRMGERQVAVQRLQALLTMQQQQQQQQQQRSQAPALTVAQQEALAQAQAQARELESQRQQALARAAEEQRRKLEQEAEERRRKAEEAVQAARAREAAAAAEAEAKRRAMAEQAKQVWGEQAAAPMTGNRAGASLQDILAQQERQASVDAQMSPKVIDIARAEREASAWGKAAAPPAAPTNGPSLLQIQEQEAEAMMRRQEAQARAQAEAAEQQRNAGWGKIVGNSSPSLKDIQDEQTSSQGPGVAAPTARVTEGGKKVSVSLTGARDKTPQSLAAMGNAIKEMLGVDKSWGGASGAGQAKSLKQIQAEEEAARQAAEASGDTAGSEVVQPRRIVQGGYASAVSANAGRSGPWGGGAGGKVKSLSEIQHEEAAKARKEAAARQEQQKLRSAAGPVPSGGNGGVWTAPAATGPVIGSTDSFPQLGAHPRPTRQAKPATRTVSAPQPVKAAQPDDPSHPNDADLFWNVATSSGKTSAAAPKAASPAANPSPAQGPTPAQAAALQRSTTKPAKAASPFGKEMPAALRTWSQQQMRRITNSEDLTLVEFCMTIQSGAEIREYLKTYLGDTPQVRAFAEEFISRKTADGGAGAAAGGWSANTRKKKGKGKR